MGMPAEEAWPNRLGEPVLPVRRFGGVGLMIESPGLVLRVEPAHPLVGPIAGAKVVSIGEEGETIVEDDAEGDVVGHGTACAGIIHMLAPKAELQHLERLFARRPGLAVPGQIPVHNQTLQVIHQGGGLVGLTWRCGIGPHPARPAAPPAAPPTPQARRSRFPSCRPRLLPTW